MGHIHFEHGEGWIKKFSSAYYMQTEESENRKVPNSSDTSQVIDMKKQFQAPIIKISDLSAEQSNEVIDIIIGNIDKFGSNLELAAKLTKETLDKQYGTTWQVILGRGYSFDITALEQNLLHCYYQGELGILVFKT